MADHGNSDCLHCAISEAIEKFIAEHPDSNDVAYLVDALSDVLGDILSGNEIYGSRLELLIRLTSGALERADEQQQQERLH